MAECHAAEDVFDEPLDRCVFGRLRSAADWEVVSFDRGFAQFKDLRHTILS